MPWLTEKLPRLLTIPKEGRSSLLVLNKNQQQSFCHNKQMESFIRTNVSVLGRRSTARPDVKLTSRRKSRGFLANFTRSRKRLVRFSLVGANLALLALAWFIVSKAPTNHSPLRLSATASPLAQATVTGPLDQVSSADIAVHIARITGLPEATSVTNHADSVSAAAVSGPADNAIVAKPQVAGGTLPTYKDIQRYTTVAGDTIASIAAKLGVSSDAIRWSNNLTGNTIAAGRQIVVPPTGMNGLVYAVKAGDTPDTLAQKFGANKAAIIDINDADVSGLKAGMEILIPDGTVRAPVVATTNYSYSSGFAWGGSSAVYSANGYDYGWCTWWAAKRRADIGRPVPSNLGNASSWRYLAARAGLAVDGRPSNGDVAYYKNIGGLGHVGYVEQVNEDGSVWISDMNYFGVSQIGGSTPAGGWGRTSYHLVSGGELGGYLFIH